MRDSRTYMGMGRLGRLGRSRFVVSLLYGTAALVLVLLGSASAGRAQNPATPLRLVVDLQEAPRHIFHAKLTIPARPGPLALLYPKWIPGEHAPDGPIQDLVGLKFTAGGKPLAWRRDDVNQYLFRLQVPEGASAVEADYDYLSPLTGQGYSAGPSADPQIVILEWNLVVLYPAGSPSDSVSYRASVLLPQAWKFASALDVERQQGAEIDFAPVTLDTLVDSPVLAGGHLRTITLAPEVQPAHRLNIAADSEDDLQLSNDQIAAYSNLVREEGKLFGARHYNHYDFLLSLTDNFFPNGLEHSQSSDVRASEHMFTNADVNVYFNSLLSHEYTHSWNGKYRRPAGLVTSDFDQPMKDDLLWVYEGLTEYIGEMIAVRAGLRTADDYREDLAATVGALNYRPGRDWRTLEDTAVSAPVLYDVSNPNWESLRRGVDFYDEGWLLWLDADILIRSQTHGQKSLDDFCRLFYGPPNSAPKVVPYTLDDIVAALNQTMPYDWRGFFEQRVDQIRPQAPMGGIDNGGWQLVYNSNPNASMRVKERVEADVDLTFSIGADVRSAGTSEEIGQLADVIPGMPAAQAGLAPGMQLRSVNGAVFTANALNDAIRASQNTTRPIVVTAANGGFVQTYQINYHGGQRYPHLQRNAAQPDLLDDTLRPLASGSGNSN